MLKIIKISDGVFRHTIKDDKGNDVFFYNTNDTTISIDLGTIRIVSAGYDRFFRLSSIEVYNGSTLIPTATIEVFIATLITLGYPPIVSAVTTNTNISNIDFDLGARADAVATTDTGTFSVISLIKRGLQNWTTLLSRIPTLDGNKTPVIPSMTSGGNVSLTTNATGTTFNTFASQACKQLTISNQTDTLIEVRQGGAGVALQIPTGSFYTFFGIANANELSVRRTDVSNTTVTVTARWEV